MHVSIGVAVSSYAKYCYRKLQKAALTGAKKVGAYNSFYFFLCSCIYLFIFSMFLYLQYCLRVKGPIK